MVNALRAYATLDCTPPGSLARLDAAVADELEGMSAKDLEDARWAYDKLGHAPALLARLDARLKGLARA